MKLSHLLKMPVIVIVCIWVFFLGLLSLYYSDQNESCAMTYMFEYPQFVRISVENTDHLPQYALYAYSEGRLTERVRKMWFDGVPVLFLPGNSGSHMQGRSLASVALRKAISSGTNFHFDFFTISFNEELSGVYGGVLEKQVEFATESISKILSLYKENKYTKSVPTSVILVGHSMGGVIAKRLLARPDTIHTTNIAIALSAPLLAPVMNFDVRMSSFYLTMNDEWEKNIRSNEMVKPNKLLLSFSGGHRDVLVPAGLTIDNDSFVNAATTSIPGVWVSPDHVGIVWCKQVVMAINRFLFSIVNPDTQQLSDNMKFIKSRAKMYFTSDRSMKPSPGTALANTAMTVDAFWYEDSRRVYQITRPEIEKLTYLMIRLVGHPHNRFVAVEAVNVSDSDWVFGCNAKEVTSTYRYCSEGNSLSKLSRWTGSATKFGRRKLATIHLHDLALRFPDWTHVVIKVSPTRKPVTLNVDINDFTSRQVDVVPMFFGKMETIPRTQPNSVYYELILPYLTTVQQAFYLYIEPTPECQATEYHVSAELQVPWSQNYEHYHYFTHTNKAPMKIRLVKTKPIKKFEGEYVKVVILLDPQCTFSISTSISWYYRMSQLVRHYIPVIIAYTGGILLLALGRSLDKFTTTGMWIPLQSSVLSLVETVLDPQVCYGLVCGVIMLVRQIETWIPTVVGAGWYNQELHLLFVLSLGVLPIVLASLSMVYLVITATELMLIFSSQITHRFLFRLVWRGDGSFAEIIASGLQKVPLVVSVGLFFGAPLSCGAASLVAGAAFYAFMVSKMYEEYLEDFTNNFLLKIKDYMASFNLIRRTINTTREHGDAPNAREEPRHNVHHNQAESDNNLNEQATNLNFHLQMFLLWLTVATLNLPALITWARNFDVERILRSDTSFVSGVLMSACSACLWQLSGPRKNLNYRVVKHLINLIALIILSLGPTSLYIVSHGIVVAILLITGQQLFEKTDNGDFFGWFAPSPVQNNLRAEEEQNNEQAAITENETNNTENEDKTENGEKKNEPDEKKSDTKEKNGKEELASAEGLPEKPSESNEQLAGEPGHLGVQESLEEDSLLNKIKKLKEKFSFIENT